MAHRQPHSPQPQPRTRLSLHTEPSPDVYFWDVPRVFNLYSAGISPPYPKDTAESLYLNLSIYYPHRAILQQIHGIPLYLNLYSSCIHTYRI